MGIEALLISKILANVITIAFICLREPKLRGIGRIPINRALAKDVFNYLDDASKHYFHTLEFNYLNLIYYHFAEVFLLRSFFVKILVYFYINIIF